MDARCKSSQQAITSTKLNQEKINADYYLNYAKDYNLRNEVLKTSLITTNTKFKQLIYFNQQCLEVK